MKFKLNKIQKCAVGLLVLVVSVIVLHNIYMINENNEILVNIKQEVINNKYVDFSKTVNEEWDNIIIVAPYTKKSEIKSKYGIDVNKISDFSIEYIDGKMLIIFCKGKSLKEYIYWPGDVLVKENEKVYGSIKIKKENTKFKAGTFQNNNKIFNLIHLSD